MIRRLAALAVATGLSMAVLWQAPPLGAQEGEEAEKGRFTRFVEETISTPDRQISLGSIDGLLSSDVRISTITIADREGVWLTINDAHLVWSRLALLRGRLDIDLLEAESIVVSRPPVPPADRPPNPSAAPGLEIPELPVELLIDRLVVPLVLLEEPVLGEPARLSVAGELQLAGGDLDANLAIVRTDDQPGELTFAANYSNETEILDLDLTLDEPAGGVLAGLLNIPDRPPVSFAIEGTGPLDAFAATIGLTVAGEQLVTGEVTVSAENGGYRFVTDLSGELQPLFPPIYDPYVAGTSTLEIDAVRAADGSIEVAQAEITSGVARLTLSGALAPDFFPTRLQVAGSLAAETGEPVPLPGGESTVRGARFTLDFGGADSRWTARFNLVSLDTATIDASGAAFTAEGEAVDLFTPESRALTATVTGALAGVTAADPELARALGDRFDVEAMVRWASGQPVVIEALEVANPNASVRFAGTLDGLALDGRTEVDAADIQPFAALAGQSLSGALDLETTGTVELATGAFDLAVEAVGRNLMTGQPRIDALLAGGSRVSGRAARTTEGLRFDNLTVATDQLSARLEGGYDLDQADLVVSATLADVATLTDRASGPVALEASITGSGTKPVVEAAVTSPRLTLTDRALADARLGFSGAIDLAALTVDGAVRVSGVLDGVPVEGRAEVITLPEQALRLSDLVLNSGETRISGDLALSEAGLADGRLIIESPDVADIAPLFLLEASGALSAGVTLAAVDGEQSARIAASARDLAVETVAVGEAEADLAIDDLYGVPRVDGTVSASRLRIGGTSIDRLAATARHEGGTTRFTADADLAAGRIETAGALAAVEDGYDVTLERFRLDRGEDLTATLAEPVTVSVRGENVEVPRALITVGDGRLAVEGTIGETLDLAVDIETLPLSLANAVRPDLDASGTVTGTVRISGTAAEPAATFDLRASEVDLAPARRWNITPLTVTATGRTEGDAILLDATASGGEAELRAVGSLPRSADGPLQLEITGEAPLAVANAVQPDLGAEGTISGTVTVSGTMAEPVAAFDLAGSDVAIAATRRAGLPPLAVEATGRYADDAVRLEATAAAEGVRLEVAGLVPLDGGAIDLRVEGEVPLAVANVVQPDLGAAGTLTGTAEVGGTLSAPTVTFDIAGSELSVAASRRAGLPALDLVATGRTEGEVVTVEATATGQGVRLELSGDIPVSGEGLQLEIEGTVPLSVANAVNPDLGATGTVTGTATVTGSFTAPQIAFDLRGSDVSVEALRTAGVPPLAVTATGRTEGDGLVVDVSASGGGLSLDASGSVPLRGGALDLAVEGTVPLALADPFLAGRGARLDGTATVAVRVGGNLAAPTVTGNVAVDGASFVDPETATRISGLTVRLRLESQQVVIEQLSGSLGDSGRIAVTGTIGIAPGSGFPADLAIVATDARFTDGRIITANVDANLRLTGPLAGAPTLAGRVVVERAEITIPETGPGAATFLDIRHRLPPPNVERTLERIRAVQAERDGEERSGLILDVEIDAPARVFVRGRGIDAELGGSLRVTGPISAVEPVGSLELIRGRVVVIGQRINFDRGTITLVGDLDPVIDFVATTRTNNITVTAEVAGVASDPQIVLSSDPDLPQDEVLAQLLFGRSISDLSPLQIASLATAVAELAGAGGGPGILGRLREATGLDDLEVITTEEGGAAVRAGRYISENVYLGVTAGPSDESSVSVNLDITEDLKARVDVSPDGGSRVGIFYETEY